MWKDLWRFKDWLWLTVACGIPFFFLQCDFLQPENQSPTVGALVTFKPNNYSKDRYFFLDTAYRRYYIRKYAPGAENPVPPPNVCTLSVWRRFDRGLTDNLKPVEPVRVDSIDQLYLYELLERDRHYYLDAEEGWIRFADSVTLQPQQQVAIFMRTADSGNPDYAHLQKGAFETVSSSDPGVEADTVPTLWTIRPMEPVDSAEVDPSRFYLLWRHVYSPVDLHDITDASLTVEYVETVGDGGEYSENHRVKSPDGAYFGDILGVTIDNKAAFGNSMVFNRQFNDLVFPPFDSSWNALEPFNNPRLGIYRDSTIYRYSDPMLRTMWLQGDFSSNYFRISFERTSRVRG